MYKVIKLSLLCALSLLAFSSNATKFTGQVDNDAYVTFAGYDLAWASPCSDGLLENSCGAIDLSEQSSYGWEIITSDLFSTLGLSASTFIVDYASANTQSYNNQNYAKATGWFSNSYTHIDVNDGVSGLWSFADVAEQQGWYETIVYRVSNTNVPEPAVYLLFALGLVGVVLARKKVA